MEHIAQWAVVQDHNFTQVRFNGAEVLDECTMAIRTMLPVVSTGEEFPFLLKPIYDRVGIFLDRCRKNHKIVPLTHLDRSANLKEWEGLTYSAQEVVTMGSFMYIIEYGVLRSDSRIPTRPNQGI